jgi:hypothetical protein
MALPPEPAMSPLRQTMSWAFRPIPFMEKCRREIGDSFSIMFLGFERPMVMVSDPVAIKALYTEREHGLPPGRNVFLEPILGSRSLLLLEGADHLAHRKLMLPAFHGERMRSYEPIVREIVDAGLGDRVGDSAGGGQVGAERLLQQQRLPCPRRHRGEFGLDGGRHGERDGLAARQQIGEVPGDGGAVRLGHLPGGLRAARPHRGQFGLGPCRQHAGVHGPRPRPRTDQPDPHRRAVPAGQRPMAASRASARSGA